MPVELFDDPIRQKVRKPCCDLADPKIRAKVDRDVEDLPGPDTANVYVYTNPCTTFCPWQLLNGTGRSFASIDGESDDEKLADLWVDWMASQMERLHAHGKVFLFENQAPDCRMPKAWDRPRLQKATENTGAIILPSCMCGWGLAPP